VADLKTLNLQLLPETSAAEIIPYRSSSSIHHLPGVSANSSPSPSTPSPTNTFSENETVIWKMNNGLPYPTKEKYELLRDELRVNHDDAFYELAHRASRPGRQRTKLTQSRKFWIGLERMSQYWDCSLDHYYEKPSPPPSTLSSGNVESRNDNENNNLNSDSMQIDKSDISVEEPATVSSNKRNYPFK
jgi:hypothetical protein